MSKCTRNWARLLARLPYWTAWFAIIRRSALIFWFYSSSSFVLSFYVTWVKSWICNLTGPLTCKKTVQNCQKWKVELCDSASINKSMATSLIPFAHSGNKKLFLEPEPKLTPLPFPVATCKTLQIHDLIGAYWFNHSLKSII